MEKNIIFATAIGILLDIILMKYLHLDKYPYTVIVNILAMLILTKTFDNSIMIVKGFLFSMILIFTAYVDFKTKIIPNMVHILIILVSLININLYKSLAGAIIVPFPFLISALLKDGGIGGGDIKLMAGIGFLLGIKNGFIAAIIGLTTAVIINGVYYKLKEQDRNISFPLAPYLGIGSFLSFLLY